MKISSGKNIKKITQRLLLLTSLFAASVLGQTLNFQYYNSTNEFPSRRVWSMYQDHSGIMWFGDLEGLLRYDGEEYQLFQARHGLPGAPVLAINELSNGLYFGTPNGLAHFKDDRATVIKTVPSVPVRVLYAEQDKLWAGTATGLYLLDKSNTECVLPDEDIRSLVMYRGDLFVGTYSGEVLCIKKPLQKELRVISSLGTTGKAIRGLVPHHDILYISSNSGLYLLNNEELEYIDLIPGQKLSISNMASDQADTLWLGTWGKSIISYNTVANKVLTFGAESGIPSPFVTGVLCDEERSLWFSFFNGGVIKYSDRSYLHYSIKGDTPITRLNIDSKGTKWFTSTEYGLMKIPAGSIEPEIAAQINLSQPTYNLFVDSKDRIWVLQPQSIYRVDGTVKDKFQLPKGNKKGAFRWVFEDAQERLWFGGTRGLARLDGNQLVDVTPKGDSKKRFWHFLELEDQSLFFSSITKLWTFRDSVFTEVPFDTGDGKEIHSLLGTPEKSILVGTTQGLFSILKNGQIHKYEATSGYSVTTLFKDSKDHIWAGSRNGIWLIKGLKAEIKYSPETTMGSVENIIEDSSGSIWFIAHNRNVTFDGQSWKERMFPNGFTIQAFNPIPIDSDGVTWFATNKGLTSYNPKAVLKNRKPPEIRSCRIVLKSGKIIDVQNGDAVALTSKQNDFTLRFGSGSFINEKLNHYDVKIDGPYSDEQSKLNKTQWELMNLPSGSYTVNIIPYNGLNQPAHKEFSFGFTINTPIWKTEIFWALLLVLLIVGIYYFIRYLDYRRIIKLEERNTWLENELKIKTKSLIEAKKKETSLALTVTLSDEISQPLMSIQGNLDLLKHKEAEDLKSDISHIENIQDSLNRIRNVMKQLRELESIEFDDYTPGIQMVNIKEDRQSNVDAGIRGILFVDDEDELLEVWKMYFETFGYRVFIAPGVDEGLTILDQHLSHIHVIISDNKMPHKTGFDFYNEVLGKSINIPFYILTGFGVEPQLKAMLSKGLQGIIQKPIKLDALHDIIKPHL